MKIICIKIPLTVIVKEYISEYQQFEINCLKMEILSKVVANLTEFWSVKWSDVCVIFTYFYNEFNIWKNTSCIYIKFIFWTRLDQWKSRNWSMAVYMISIYTDWIWWTGLDYWKFNAISICGIMYMAKNVQVVQVL